MADGAGPPDSFEAFKIQNRPFAPPPPPGVAEVAARSGSPVLEALGAGWDAVVGRVSAVAGGVRTGASAVAGGVSSGLGAARDAARAVSGRRLPEESEEEMEERLARAAAAQQERLEREAIEQAATARRNELMLEYRIPALKATEELDAAFGSQRQQLKHAYEARVAELEQKNFLRGLELPLTPAEVDELISKKAAILQKGRPGGRLTDGTDILRLRRFEGVQKAYNEFLDAYDRALQIHESGPILERLRSIRENVVPNLLRAMDRSEDEITEILRTIRHRNQAAQAVAHEEPRPEEWGLFRRAERGGAAAAPAPVPARQSFVRRPSRKQRGGKRKTQKSKAKRSKRSTRRHKRS